MTNNVEGAIRAETDFVSPNSMRHGMPRAGLSLAAITEIRGAPVRKAVRTLVDGLIGTEAGTAYIYEQNLKPSTLRSDDIARRTAWNLISVWLLARQSGICGSSGLTIRDAESWFRGERPGLQPSLIEQFSPASRLKAEESLRTTRFDDEFRQLLPYIFEEHGPGSRASVIKDPATASSRFAKRESGIFYTPVDVADYMVGHLRKLFTGDFLTAKALDPACGTGVFLLSLLRETKSLRDAAFSRFDYVSSCLFGMDISSQALDAAAFLLLGECVSDVLARQLCPFDAWNLIRRNLVEIDSPSIDVSERDDSGPSGDLFHTPSLRLQDLFPHIQDGFDLLVGNPPYAELGQRSDYWPLTTRFASLKGVKASKQLNLFPLFVEFSWRFTKPSCGAAALVAPLSIAFHNGAQYKNCRRAMSKNGGRWQFVFFDREPHALFGEEVKTRNAIIFRSENRETPQRGQAATIETGPLRKWTSRTRPMLFDEIAFTAMDSVDVTAGIPKLSGTTQAHAFMQLSRRSDRFSSTAIRIGRCTLADTLISDDVPKVFVGGTAYNFLNIYRPHGFTMDKNIFPLSESPVSCLEFKSEKEARGAFAILGSRLVFWLWRVLGDGFHVSSKFLQSIPFERASFAKAEFDSLSRVGNSLWRKIQKHRFVSVNRGKSSIGFRPLCCQSERDTIDAILLKISGIDVRFAAELQNFVQENTVVDAKDMRRNHLARHFTKTNEP